MYRLLVLLSLLSPLTMAAEIDKRAALEALKRSDTVLIDVRSAEEHAEGALPGSIRIPPEELLENIANVAPDKDRPVVLYCRTGRRSSAAQDMLPQLGYGKVINAGGYQQLREAIQRE